LVWRAALTVAVSGGKETLPVPEVVISVIPGCAAAAKLPVRKNVASRQRKVRFITP
jgi:hypothetical protein